MRSVAAPKVWVTGLTVAAIAGVAVLAVQADKGPKPVAARPGASASAHPKPTRSAGPAAVPDGSGTGRRVVYSLGRRTVWLVDASDAARRTFGVWPGTVSPDPGTYTIGTRNEGPIKGTDGVQIEHIMYFALKSGVNLAFSSAVDGSSPPPPSGTPTGGIRMRTADGAALWTFGSTGTKVTVVN
jgi:hypothetical protein